METENTPGAQSQPQADSADTAPSQDVFSVESEINAILSESEAKQTAAAPEAQEAQAEAEAVAEQPSDESAPEATQQSSLRSPMLAEKARLDREARAEVQALKASREQELADAKAEVVKALLANPSKFFDDHDITDTEDLALHAYARGLGDDAPADLKAQVGASEQERQLAAMRKEISDLESRLTQRAAAEKSQAILDQYSGLLEDVPADFKYLAADAAENREEALTTMAQVADHVHSTTGRFPSAVEVAKMIDDEIRSQAARYQAILGSTSVPKEQVTEHVSTNQSEIDTLSTELSGKAARPVDEIDEEESDEERFAAALRLLDAQTASD